MEEKVMNVESTPLGKILGEDAKHVKEIVVNFREAYCSSCGCRSFNVLYNPLRFRCRKCGKVRTKEKMREECVRC